MRSTASSGWMEVTPLPRPSLTATVVMAGISSRAKSQDVYKRQAGKAARVHRLLKRLRQRRLRKLHRRVLAADALHGQGDVGRVARGLKGVGAEVAVVALVVHGKAAHRLHALAQKRGQKRGVDAAGEHGGGSQRRDVVHGALDHHAHRLHRGRRVVLVFARLKADVYKRQGLMKPERFERELRYQTMISICRSLLKAGILSQADFDEAERYLRAKYQPIFTAA